MNSIFCLPNIISEFKSSLRLALPLIAAELIYALNGFIATVMVAHLSKEQLAANALAWTIYFSVIIFFIGVFCSVSIMVAQSSGAKDDNGISICFKQGLILATILSIPMMAIMWTVPSFLLWTGQDPIVVEYAKPFFYALAWSMLPLNLQLVIQQFLVGMGKTGLVMFMNIIIVPLQISFYYLFLFGKFGFPKLGLAGIGYGMAITFCIIALSFFAYLYFSRELRKFNLFNKWWVIEPKFLIEMLRIGSPLGAMWFSEVVFFAVIAIMMGKFGITTLAAFQIADQYLLLAIVILFATSQTAAIRVGNEVGRDDRNKIKLAASVNVIISFVLISVFSMFYIFFPEKAISLDIDINSDNFQAIFNETIKYFPIIATLLLVDSARIVINGALRGLKDTRFQMLLSIIGFWIVAFPAAYFLGFKLGLGGAGIWWGVVIGLSINGILILLRFNRLVKRVDLSLLITKK